MEKLSRSPYTQLFLSLIFLFLIAPFLEGNPWRRLVLSTCLLVVSILSLRAVNFQKVYLPLYVGLSGLAFTFGIFSQIDFLLAQHELIFAISQSIYGLLFIRAIVAIARQLSISVEVNYDAIIGGVCIYLFFGFLWALFYSILYRIDNDSFLFSVESRDLHLIYFSFTTLTTLGYGDVIPKSSMAMVLADLEAIIGQMYPAIFISQLVGLYVIRELQGKP